MDPSGYNLGYNFVRPNLRKTLLFFPQRPVTVPVFGTARIYTHIFARRPPPGNLVQDFSSLALGREGQVWSDLSTDRTRTRQAAVLEQRWSSSVPSPRPATGMWCNVAWSIGNARARCRQSCNAQVRGDPHTLLYICLTCSYSAPGMGNHSSWIPLLAMSMGEPGDVPAAVQKSFAVYLWEVSNTANEAHNNSKGPRGCICRNG